MRRTHTQRARDANCRQSRACRARRTRSLPLQLRAAGAVQSGRSAQRRRRRNDTSRRRIASLALQFDLRRRRRDTHTPSLFLRLCRQANELDSEFATKAALAWRCSGRSGNGARAQPARVAQHLSRRREIEIQQMQFNCQVFLRRKLRRNSPKLGAPPPLVAECADLKRRKVPPFRVLNGERSIMLIAIYLRAGRGELHELLREPGQTLCNHISPADVVVVVVFIRLANRSNWAIKREPNRTKSAASSRVENSIGSLRK